MVPNPSSHSWPPPEPSIVVEPWMAMEVVKDLEREKVEKRIYTLHWHQSIPFQIMVIAIKATASTCILIRIIREALRTELERTPPKWPTHVTQLLSRMYLNLAVTVTKMLPKPEKKNQDQVAANAGALSAVRGLASALLSTTGQDSKSTAHRHAKKP